MVSSVLQREEQIRDLRRSIEGLTAEEEADAPVIFRENSARRQLQLLYRVSDGEPVRMKLALARRVIHSFDFRGQPKWTTDPAQAATWKLGDVKCFMHPESPEAESGLLAELGIAPVCDAGNLRNLNSKRTHGKHCHKQEWADYTEYLASEERRQEREMRQEEVGAMKSLAGQRSTPFTVAKADVGDTSLVVTDVADLVCECGWDKGKNKASLATHKRMHCPLREGASE